MYSVCVMFLVLGWVCECFFFLFWPSARLVSVNVFYGHIIRVTAFVTVCFTINACYDNNINYQNGTCNINNGSLNCLPPFTRPISTLTDAWLRPVSHVCVSSVMTSGHHLTCLWSRAFSTAQCANYCLIVMWEFMFVCSLENVVMINTWELLEGRVMSRDVVRLIRGRGTSWMK